MVLHSYYESFLAKILAKLTGSRKEISSKIRFVSGIFQIDK